MKSFHIDAKNGITEGELTVFVPHKVILNQLIARLKKVDGIKTVSRIE
jgi:hypothetical protein